MVTLLLAVDIIVVVAAMAAPTAAPIELGDSTSVSTQRRKEGKGVLEGRREARRVDYGC